MEFLPDASKRINGNRSSTLRRFVLDFYRSQGSSELQLANAPTPPDGGGYQECGSALETDRLAVGAILDVTGRPQTRLGFWFFTIPRISVLEYK